MRFISDNAASVHPKVWQAMQAADASDLGYDGDRLSERLDAAFSAAFGTECAALWVATGTAGNGLALAALCPPHGAIVCHREAHIEVDEGGAPAFFTHGAKLVLVDGDGAKLSAVSLAEVLDAIRPNVHQVQPHAISLTQATEYGRVYSAEELVAIGSLAAERGLALHIDGARFANAVAHLGCEPAAVSWRAGAQALTFGFIKNGGMGAEALVLFDPSLADLVRYRRKRAGHLQSKGRFLAAQLLALLENDLWLANARHANAAAQELAAACGDRLLHAVEANELFVRLTPAEAAALRAQGFEFYDWNPGMARFVTAWNSDARDTAALARAIAAL